MAFLDNKYAGDFASIGGWRDFTGWVDSLPLIPCLELHHLASYGWSQRLEFLEEALDTATGKHAPEDVTILDTAHGLEHMLHQRKDVEVLVITDGFPGPGEPEEKTFQPRTKAAKKPPPLSEDDADDVEAFVTDISGETPITDHAGGDVIGTLTAATAASFWRATLTDQAPAGKPVIEPKGPISYHAPTQRFATTAGRPIRPETVKASAEAAVNNARFRIHDLTLQLQQGKLPAGEWEAGMRDAIRDLHGGNAALAHGGFEQMDVLDWSQASETVKDQFGWFDGFAKDVADGKYDAPEGEDGLTDAVLARAESYANAGRATFENTRVAVAIEDLGHDEGRSIRGAVDSCDDCVEQDELEWQPIDDVTPIGDRECLSNCYCTIITRKSSGDEGDD